ncbi:hypothetical protein G6M89_10240 [Natronolimnobius sp. AArcel1]|uniref:hypothetical protein n=1 Tax=Natronolimnobius sp. AArcel1 TaxID=1679093 RepID=UPI0013ECEF69|nr:hypothetical protein [Natronolimnobius sp. AArcel1]NGM69382.1 hypothetical protein [Natronolimnobius sp. AArcel1]
MYRRLFVATALLAFVVRLGEAAVALGSGHPVWHWLEASWTVAWIGVGSVGVGCYCVGDRIDLEAGRRTALVFIGAFIGGPIIGYGVGSALLIGVGLEGALTPVGALITGVFLGLYVLFGGMAGVTARNVMNGDHVVNARLLTSAGVLMFIVAAATMSEYGYGTWADAWFFILLSSYLLGLAGLQRHSRTVDSSPQ